MLGARRLYRSDIVIRTFAGAIMTVLVYCLTRGGVISVNAGRSFLVVFISPDKVDSRYCGDQTEKPHGPGLMLSSMHD